MSLGGSGEAGPSAAGRMAAAPLFVQLVVLLFGTFALIQIAGAAILFILPPPRASVVHLTAAAAALSGRTPPPRGFDVSVVSADAVLLSPASDRRHRSWLARRLHPHHPFPPIGPAGPLAPLPLRPPPGERPERPPPEFRDAQDDRLDQWLAARLGAPADRVRVWRGPPHGRGEPFSAADGPDPVVTTPVAVGLRLPDGRWRVAVKGRDDGLEMLWRLGVWLGLTLVIIAPIAFLLARRLTRPVASFAAAAERLGQDPGAAPLAINGPREVRAAVRAFNTMQQRLASYVTDRVRLVGAIAHDLRTPLTRLKIQIDGLPPGVRLRAEQEIAAMEQLIDTTLAFVKDADAVHGRDPLHLLSLVESVVDDLAEVGVAVTAAGEASPVVSGDALALRRLLTNLIDNAVKYGRRARCRVRVDGADAVILVDDDGPGLPTADLDRVFEPFVRGEASRSIETGGIGLGLSIVRTIARAHGGEVRLINRPGGGLTAEVRLPQLAPA